MKKVWLILAVAVLLAGCTPTTSDNSIAGQLKGNQAVLLSLQNAGDLNHLYFYYNSLPNNDLAAKSSNPLPGGLVQIGELNLLMQNIGGSVTAGGIFVSGYDPSLITVMSKLGQNPIDTGTKRNCYENIGITSTGNYDVTVFCEPVGSGISYGGHVSGTNDNTQTAIATVRNLPLDKWADAIASEITGKNSNFFTTNGIFSNSSVNCGLQNGKFGCSIQLGNPAFNPNRASHGYILTNILYSQLTPCANNCRVFPPTFMNGAVLHGISDEYPQGEALFYDYDIYLNRGAWNPLLNDLQQTFQVTACYGYTTTVTPTVCVDPQPTVNKVKPCSTAPLIFKNSQGAPIQVTRIDQVSRPGAVAFTIYLQHVGNGQVYLPGAFDMCSPWSPARPDPRKMDAVTLLDARISGDLQQLQCMPSDQKEKIIRLENGKGQITCLYPLSTGYSNNAYQTALTLEFGYVYSNTVSKQVVIHRT